MGRCSFYSELQQGNARRFKDEKSILVALQHWGTESINPEPLKEKAVALRDASLATASGLSNAIGTPGCASDVFRGPCAARCSLATRHLVQCVSESTNACAPWSATPCSPTSHNSAKLSHSPGMFPPTPGRGLRSQAPIGPGIPCYSKWTCASAVKAWRLFSARLWVSRLSAGAKPRPRNAS